MNKIYIPRNIENTLKEFVREFPAVALSGPRQAGKSTLLSKLFGDTHNIISFDDPLTRERALSDPYLFLETAGTRVIFDEIQYVPEILPYIKILIDKDRNNRGRFIMTGSSQFNLMKNLTETLAGRIGILTLLPFAESEKETISELRDKLTTTKDQFINSSIRGSFPEISLHPEINANHWYANYLSTYLERDIRSLYNIGSLREFQRFLQVLASRCSQILNLSSLANDLGVAVNTIKKWVSVLEASQIIYILPPYFQNFGKRLTKSPKVYFLDCGLVCYLVGLKEEEHLLKGPMAGALFENYCIQETVKSFFNQGLRPNIFYLRTHNGLEIDLLIEKDNLLYPFEIKMTKTLTMKMATSIERFKRLFSNLSIKEGKIISFNEEEIPLSRDVCSQSMNSYLKWLQGL
ncbi:MAG: ATP-binding protein [Candidatus Desantisbacteria bacterium]